MPPAPTYTQEAWDAFLEHLAVLGNPFRVFKLAGMPSRVLFYRRMSKNAEFAATVSAIWTPDKRAKPVKPSVWYAFLRNLAEVGSIGAACALKGMPSHAAVTRKMKADARFAERVNAVWRRQECSPEVWDALLEHLKTYSMAEACELPGMPTEGTLRRKRARDPDYDGRVRAVLTSSECRHLHQPRYSSETWDALLEHLTTKSIAEACRLSDMPHQESVYRHIRSNPAFAAKVAEIRGKAFRRKTRFDRHLDETDVEEVWERFLEALRTVPLKTLCSIPDMPSTTAFDSKRRRDQTFNRRVTQILMETGRHRVRLTAARWEAFLVGLDTCRTLTELCDDQEMPSESTVRHRCRSDPAFASRLASALRKQKKRRIAERLAARRGRKVKSRNPVDQIKPAYTFERQLSHDAVYRAVAAVVPTSLPPITRDDIICDMVLAVLDGSLTMGELKSRSREFVREHWRLFGTLREVSLDAQLFDDSGATRGDRLVGHGADYW